MASLAQTSLATVNKKCERLNDRRMGRSSQRTPLYKRANCGTLERRVSAQHLFSLDRPHNFHPQETRHNLLHLSSRENRKHAAFLRLQEDLLRNGMRCEDPPLKIAAAYFTPSNRFISTLLKIRDLDKNILP